MNAMNYEWFQCRDAREAQKVFDKNKDKQGFYPYYIPQAEGVLLCIGTVNPKARPKEKRRIVKGLSPLTESEAHKLPRSRDTQSTFSFIVWLYENDYQIVKLVPQKEGKP